MKCAVVFLILAFAAVPVIFSTPKAFACSCVQPRPPAQALEESAAVFTGRVVDVEPVVSGSNVQFSVDRAWKGVSSTSVKITTSQIGGACGYPFDEGTKYVVYAHGSESLETSICTRTQPVADAYEDLAYLGEGYVPVAGQPPVEKTPSSPFMPFVGIGAAVAGVIAFLVLRSRRT